MAQPTWALQPLHGPVRVLEYPYGYQMMTHPVADKKLPEKLRSWENHIHAIHSFGHYYKNAITKPQERNI